MLRDNAVAAGAATSDIADAALSIARVRVSLQEAASAASATAVPPAMIVGRSRVERGARDCRVVADVGRIGRWPPNDVGDV